MKVGELITKLQTYDPDALVYVARDSEESELNEPDIEQADQVMDADDGEQLFAKGAKHDEPPPDAIDLFDDEDDEDDVSIRDAPYFVVFTTWS